MELPGVLKKLQEEFLGFNKKQSVISRGGQERVLDLGLKILKGCYNKILWSV